MKRILVATILALLVFSPMARANGPDDQYVSIYTLIQQADALNDKGEAAAALAKYNEAQYALTRFQASFPDTDVKVVKFRLGYLATKITQLTATVNAQEKSETNAPPSGPVTPGATNAATQVAAPSPAAIELQNQVKGLQEQVRRLETDRSSLEAKLKEALAAQPAAVDPQEFAKAQAQIVNLQKENELLKAGIATAKTNVVNTAEMEKNQRALDEANRKVTALNEANANLTLEKDMLQARVKSLGTPDSATAALRDENAILKKQVADLKASAAANAAFTAGSSSGDTDRKLKEAQAQVAALQSDKEILRLEKIALEQRVKQQSTATTSAPAPVATPNTVPAVTRAPELVDSVTTSKIAQLEAQRDELQKSLDAATRDIKGRRKGKELSDHVEDMTRQLASLHARIQLLEAHPVPYTDAELALLAKPDNALSASVHLSAKKAVKELPPAGTVLLAEAKRYFVAGDFANAEAKYLQVLKLDENNFATLADLASIQLQMGHDADVEKNLKAALAIEPNDDYSLFLMGQLKFQEKKYDEALDSLSRAAEISPQNARIQNFIGLTLERKRHSRPGRDCLSPRHSIGPRFCRGAHQSRSSLCHRRAAAHGTRALALPKGPRRRPSGQSQAGTNSRPVQNRRNTLNAFGVRALTGF